MNPQERDTVTSTKSTTKATTGGYGAATPRPDAVMAKANRKRRTPEDQQPTPPEVISLPNKAHRRDSQDDSSSGERLNRPNVASTKRRKIEQDDGAEQTDDSASNAELGKNHTDPANISSTSEIEECKNETTYDTASELGPTVKTSESTAPVPATTICDSGNSVPTNETMDYASLKRPISRRGDETARMRKTMQWLEEGSRRLREELAKTRAELHEERRAAKIARRQLDATIKEARSAEAAKYIDLVAELRNRISQPPPPDSVNKAKNDFLKDENHRRLVAALKKRLAEAETTIQKLKTESLNLVLQSEKKVKEEELTRFSNIGLRKLEVEVQTLRAANKRLEEKLAVVSNLEKRTYTPGIDHRATGQRDGISSIYKIVANLRRKFCSPKAR